MYWVIVDNMIRSRTRIFDWFNGMILKKNHQNGKVQLKTNQQIDIRKSYMLGAPFIIKKEHKLPFKAFKSRKKQLFECSDFSNDLSQSQGKNHKAWLQNNLERFGQLMESVILLWEYGCSDKAGNHTFRGSMAQPNGGSMASLTLQRNGEIMAALTHCDTTASQPPQQLKGRNTHTRRTKKPDSTKKNQQNPIAWCRKKVENASKNEDILKTFISKTQQDFGYSYPPQAKRVGAWLL